MKKSKFFLSSIALGCLIFTSSCSFFNDDDLSISNSFRTITTATATYEPRPGVVTVSGGVEEKPAKLDGLTQPTKCFKNISYAKETVVGEETIYSIDNTYKAGGIHENEYHVNNDKDYPATATSNTYDLYVPDAAKKNDKHAVVLFIHGGAWISGSKSDVNTYVSEFAERGFITATIKYTLLSKDMNDNSLSIFRDLDEIDACIKSIKAVLGSEALGFDTSKSQFAIGGASSGAHLAMLYSYSRGADCAFESGIKLLVDVVGPVDIKPESWKRFNVNSQAVLDAGITASAIEAQMAASNISNLTIVGDGHTWGDYQTARIANGMCGIPFGPDKMEECTDDNVQEDILTPNDASNSMTKVGGGEDLLSVTHYINSSNKIPMICAYGGQDVVVGIAQFARLQSALDAAGAVIDSDYSFFYFKNANHMDIDKKDSENFDETTYNNFIQKIVQQLQSLIA